MQNSFKIKLRHLLLIVLMIFHVSLCYAQIHIVSTTSPIASLIKTIGGKYVEISILQKQQGCPHHYQITPSNLEELQNSDYIVTIDGSFETYLDVIQRRLPNKEIIYISTFEDLHLKSLNNKRYNWHLWLDLRNSAQILRYFTHFLSDNMPEQKSYFEDNLNNALAKIKILQAKQNQIYQKLLPSFIWSNDLIYLYTPTLPHIEFSGLRNDPYQLIKFAKKNITPTTCILSTEKHYHRQILKTIPQHSKFAIINGDNWKEPQDEEMIADLYFNKFQQILSTIKKQCLKEVAD